MTSVNATRTYLRNINGYKLVFLKLPLWLRSCPKCKNSENGKSVQDIPIGKGKRKKILSSVWILVSYIRIHYNFSHETHKEMWRQSEILIDTDSFSGPNGIIVLIYIRAEHLPKYATVLICVHIIMLSGLLVKTHPFHSGFQGSAVSNTNRWLNFTGCSVLSITIQLGLLCG